MNLSRPKQVESRLALPVHCDLLLVTLVRGTIMPGAAASMAGRQHHSAQTAAEEVREEAIISKEVLHEIPPPEARVFDGRWEKQSVNSKGI